jgi:ribosomal protein S18 acetylase RimI-like enzyme
MSPIGVAFRQASPQDFDYCAKLYFAGMEQIIRQLNLGMDRQITTFQKQWEPAQVQVITLNGTDVGWLQSMTAEGALFLAQLFVDAPVQRRGIGTEVMRRLIGEASRSGRAVELAVVKINPALRLYERLGFKTTHEDDLKFYMRREPDAAAPKSM